MTTRLPFEPDAPLEEAPAPSAKGPVALLLFAPSVLFAIVGVGPRVLDAPTAGGVAVLAVLVSAFAAPFAIYARRALASA